MSHHPEEFDNNVHQNGQNANSDGTTNEIEVEQSTQLIGNNNNQPRSPVGTISEIRSDQNERRKKRTEDRRTLSLNQRPALSTHFQHYRSPIRNLPSNPQISTGIAPTPPQDQSTTPNSIDDIDDTISPSQDQPTPSGDPQDTLNSTVSSQDTAAQGPDINTEVTNTNNSHPVAELANIVFEGFDPLSDYPDNIPFSQRWDDQIPEFERYFHRCAYNCVKKGGENKVSISKSAPIKTSLVCTMCITGSLPVHNCIKDCGHKGKSNNPSYEPTDDITPFIEDGCTVPEVKSELYYYLNRIYYHITAKPLPGSEEAPSFIAFLRSVLRTTVKAPSMAAHRILIRFNAAVRRREVAKLVITPQMIQILNRLPSDMTLLMMLNEIRKLFIEYNPSPELCMKILQRSKIHRRPLGWVEKMDVLTDKTYAPLRAVFYIELRMSLESRYIIGFMDESWLDYLQNSSKHRFVWGDKAIGTTQNSIRYLHSMSRIALVYCLMDKHGIHKTTTESDINLNRFRLGNVSLNVSGAMFIPENRRVAHNNDTRETAANDTPVVYPSPSGPIINQEKPHLTHMALLVLQYLSIYSIFGQLKSGDFSVAEELIGIAHILAVGDTPQLSSDDIGVSVVEYLFSHCIWGLPSSFELIEAIKEFHYQNTIYSSKLLKLFSQTTVPIVLETINITEDITVQSRRARPVWDDDGVDLRSNQLRSDVQSQLLPQQLVINNNSEQPQPQPIINAEPAPTQRRTQERLRSRQQQAYQPRLVPFTTDITIESYQARMNVENLAGYFGPMTNDSHQYTITLESARNCVSAIGAGCDCDTILTVFTHSGNNFNDQTNLEDLTPESFQYVSNEFIISMNASGGTRDVIKFYLTPTPWCIGSSDYILWVLESANSTEIFTFTHSKEVADALKDKIKGGDYNRVVPKVLSQLTYILYPPPCHGYVGRSQYDTLTPVFPAADLSPRTSTIPQIVSSVQSTETTRDLEALRYVNSLRDVPTRSDEDLEKAVKCVAVCGELLDLLEESTSYNQVPLQLRKYYEDIARRVTCLVPSTHPHYKPVHKTPNEQGVDYHLQHDTESTMDVLRKIFLENIILCYIYDRPGFRLILDRATYHTTRIPNIPTTTTTTTNGDGNGDVEDDSDDDDDDNNEQDTPQEFILFASNYDEYVEVVSSPSDEHQSVYELRPRNNSPTYAEEMSDEVSTDVPTSNTIDSSTRPVPVILKHIREFLNMSKNEGYDNTTRMSSYRKLDCVNYIIVNNIDVVTLLQYGDIVKSKYDGEEYDDIIATKNIRQRVIDSYHSLQSLASRDEPLSHADFRTVQLVLLKEIVMKMEEKKPYRTYLNRMLKEIRSVVAEALREKGIDIEVPQLCYIYTPPKHYMFNLAIERLWAYVKTNLHSWKYDTTSSLLKYLSDINNIIADEAPKSSMNFLSAYQEAEKAVFRDINMGYLDGTDYIDKLKVAVNNAPLFKCNQVPRAIINSTTSSTPATTTTTTATTTTATITTTTTTTTTSSPF